MAEQSQRVIIERTEDGGWSISDEGGYFATAYDPGQVIPYVLDLLYGPPTHGEDFQIAFGRAGAPPSDFVRRPRRSRQDDDG